ncbi:EGFR-like transmembrane domain-containing protein [Aspergillus neoniger CBS 115656]|uniref:Extracellular serine-rich protein n=1 Tax=Aspergillus neoniger (strain CBS 115656) TaxID=1448310 RepID=A0A318YML5_ASPNB|nr:hypothetical protein BO87DRAFT_344577 [Aspergillus neoniger CBS 115656]PYH29468.1 hypothetical protein BO87DRAFT_344577 [Aspergillus neoniger CBS 115656]
MLSLLMAAHLLALVAMLLATTASAQSHSSTTGISTTSTTRATSTTTTAIATHTVQVGSKEDPHQYSPHNVSAAVGDIIVFEFYPRNHSVVKADYLAPCVPASGEIFYSGIFNSFNEEDGQLVGPPPTWSLVVNDTEPAFFYCTAIDSCIGNGMVGVINPNSTMTFESQYNRAKTYPYMLVPGQSIPAEGTIAPTSTSTSTSSPSNTPSTSSPALSTGAIVGIVIGSVAFIAILGALFFLLGRNRVYRQWMSSQDGRHERTARWAALLSPGQSTGKGGSNSAAGGGGGQRKSEMDGGSALVPQSEFSGATVGSGLSPPLGQGMWGWDGQQSPQHMQMQQPVGGGIYQGPHGQGQGQGQVMYEAMVRGPSELDGSGRT